MVEGGYFSYPFAHPRMRLGLNNILPSNASIPSLFLLNQSPN